MKGTIHWVCASTAVKAQCRLYVNIVDEEKGVYNKEDGSLNVNPNSLTVVEEAYVEPELGARQEPMTAISLSGMDFSAATVMIQNRERRCLTVSYP